jgi:environmental stress-induced protein Ves
MSWQQIRLDDVPPTPWKPGGGQTRELLAWPRADDWVVRLSVADIDRDGPFSAFPGVDRWFAVLEGAGVWLDDVRVDARTGAYAFAGDAPPFARLIDGATRDLNLMLRRGAARGQLRRLVRDETLEPDARGPADRLLIGVLTAEASTIETSSTPRFELPPHMAAWTCVTHGDGAITLAQGSAWGWWAVVSDTALPSHGERA